ncbi:cysteine peptidase family C39 domain-containing protein [Cyanobium sp. Alchichica 3B3-8F6]|uniref:cysteine peptidase family C39 domain-containing protein n=1 Tax=Cyanobium sp. Alchichica 3B3-8F6 TaxID=2823696 RepID=UPI0020CEAC35|nr:cysteine peptidase family C39 domain-containing protein [Cyanobium sp. Alchichica 3B3-8F6]
MYKAVPTTLQMQSADCGAASLKMILDSYGQKHTLEEVRTSIGIGRDGSTIGDIKRAGSLLGIELEASRIEKEKIWFVTPPCIIWWNSNHFVVYEGTRKKTFFINDPAIGRRELAELDFTNQFTGVVIRPVDPSFTGNYTSPNIITNGSLFEFFFGSSLKPVHLVIALSVSSVVPSVLSAQITSYFIDTILGQAEFLAALPLLWLLFLLSGVISAVNFLSFRISSQVAYISSITKTVEFLRSMVSRPFTWYANRQVTELATRIMVPSKSVSTFIYELSAQIATLISTVLVIIFLMFASWQIGLFCLFVVVITFYFAITINLSVDNQNRLISIESGKQQGLALLTLSEINLVRTAGLENQRFATWAGYYTNFVNSQISVSNSLSVIGLIANSAFYFLNVGLLVLGPILIIHHSMSLGDFISVSYLMGMISSGIISVPSILASLQEIAAPVDRIKDVFEAPDAASDDKDLSTINPQDCGSNISTLVFEDVEFEFSPNNKVFNKLKFETELSGVIGIIGPPAIGKSVLLQMLVGFYKPTDGEIMWKSKDGFSSSSNCLGCIYLPQQPVIIEGSLLDNIVLKDDSITHENSINALRQSGLLTSSRGSKSLSAATRLDFGGNSISITIQQRIFLARAYASASKERILIVDNCFDQLNRDELFIHLERFRSLYCCLFIVLDGADGAACDYILDLTSLNRLSSTPNS